MYMTILTILSCMVIRLD